MTANFQEDPITKPFVDNCLLGEKISLYFERFKIGHAHLKIYLLHNYTFSSPSVSNKFCLLFRKVRRPFQ